jgi:MFS family permease
MKTNNIITNKDFEDRSYKQSIFKITFLFFVLNFILASFLYIYHITSQKEDLFAAMGEKSQTIGYSVVDLYQKATELGIPLNEVVGGNEYLDESMKASKELEYLVVTDAKGDVIARSTEIEDKTKQNARHERLKGHFKVFARSVETINEKIFLFKIYSYTNIPLRIINNGKLEGYLHVGVSNQAIDANIDNIFYDIALILFASLLIGYEFLSYIFRNSMIQPMLDFNRALHRIDDRDFSEVESSRTKDNFGNILDDLNKNTIKLTTWFASIKDRLKNISPTNGHYDIIKDSIYEMSRKFKYPEEEIKVNPVTPVVINLRLVMFLVILGEAILIPSIPSYAATYFQPSFFITSVQFLSALPIIIYMTFVCIGIPLVPKLSYRIGFKKSFMLGAFISAAGYLIGFMFEHLAGLLVSRLISAIGFSICFVSSQNYVAAYAAEQSRIQSYSIINIASGAAYICGMPVGGILVDTVGYRPLFFFSFLCSIACFVISKRYIVDIGNVTLRKKRHTEKSMRDLFKIKELVFAVLCSCLPTRLLFTGVICFLYPLYLHSLGNSQSIVGRIMMLYGLITYLIASSVPKYVKKIKNPALLTVYMSVLITIPMMVHPFYKSTQAIIAEILVNTTCVIIYISAQMNILDRISVKYSQEHTKTAILGFYYLFERIGMIFGPVITSLILIKTDFSHTLFYLGLGLFVINVIYLIFLVYQKLQQKVA